MGPETTTTAKIQRGLPMNRPPIKITSRAVDDGSPFAKKAKGRKFARESREYPTGVDNVALEAKVEELSAKIQELTALIMAQQDKGAPE